MQKIRKKYTEYKTSNFFRIYSRNPNLTAEFVEKYIDENWNWSFISSNKFEKDKYYKGHRK